MTNPPFVDIPLGSRAVRHRWRKDGALEMASAEPLAGYPRTLTERLMDTAASHPDRVFLAQRPPTGAEGWETLTYGAAAAKITALAQALLGLGVSAERPVAILSGGSVAHGLVALAAQHVGVPHVPVSPAYSLLASDFTKLDHVLRLVTPGLVFVEDATAYRRALSGSLARDLPVLAARGAGAGQLMLDEVLRTPEQGEVARAHAAIRGGDVAKILFTSGSMGMPKGVINTHEMICANQQMFLQSIPAIAADPPVILSWLPWHHTSGANMILGMAIYNGGSLYIDAGRPVPGQMGPTITALREVPTTAYFSAPSAFDALIPLLAEDAKLRETFFRHLKFLYYSGATLLPGTIAQMDEQAIRATGRRVPFFSNYGATETAPFALAVNWPDGRSGLAGLPVPGVTLKLQPVDGRFEARLRGPSVTPGYWRQPEATAQAFDDEGFYCYGDSLAPLDPAQPGLGLTFDGRLGENFKLATGTWVSVATLRERLVTAGAPLVRDAAITGEGHAAVGALIFPAVAQARALSGLRDDAPMNEVCGSAPVRAALQAVLDDLAGKATGSSTFVARALVLPDPPDATAGEVTDKGSLSQKTVLRLRADDVLRLYADDAAAIVARV